MRVSQRLAVILGMVLATASLGFAQGGGGTRGTDGGVLRAANDNPATAPAPAEPTPAPAPAPQGRAGATASSEPNAASARLIPTTAGPLGLFTLETGDLLSRHDWSVVGYANKFSRMPGSVTVLNLGFNFGYGVTDWLNLYAGFEPYRHTHVSKPAQLSLDSPQANPIFPNTGFRTLLPGASPAYVEDYPFASKNDGGVGEFTIGGKLGLLSETQGHPLSLSLRDELIIPTRTSLADLLGNGTQTGKLSDLLSLAVSRNWTDKVTLAANVGARFGRSLNAGGAHLVDQASQVRFGAGFILMPQSRVQFMNEYTAVVFAGTSTPNQSFGARDPLDGVWGVRLFPTNDLGMDIGYRHMLNLSNAQDRHGFVLKLGYAHHPAPPPPPAPNRQPSVACSANPATIVTGSTAPVNITATASDPDGDTLVYSWSATAGTVEGAGAQVRWVPGNLGPGNYRVNMSVSDNKGGTASCSADLRVDPRPNRPPTVTVTGDRQTVLVGERVGFRANCTDPDNDPVTYTWRANGGQIVGNGAAIQFDTTGLAPGTYTVTVRCEDGKGGAADATATVQVQAPPPPPMASKLSQCDFRAANSARIDNVCKRLLDDIALRLQNDPRATVVIVGYADPRERRPDQLADTRATNAVNYLAMDRGVDRARTSTRTGAGQAGAGAANRHIDIIWVPAGATY
jgi:outer membrane protein OmpA-like peptidoglycan-associated protein